MALSKWLRIDNIEYQVPIVDMQRKGDILDLTANRTEDGVLHREVIGTYYNYTLTIGVINDPDLYDRLWWVLTAPVASHLVQLPNQTEPFVGYFSSCKDSIVHITETGIKAKGLTCNLTATMPSRPSRLEV